MQATTMAKLTRGGIFGSPRQLLLLIHHCQSGSSFDDVLLTAEAD
jgi:hypothetical protein